MAQPDRLERVTDLLLVLLDASRPLSLREIADRVPGYPAGHEARRQAFERDKRLLRDEGVPVLAESIEAEEQVGYRVDPDAYYLPDLGLEPDEQAALNLAVAGVHLGEPIGREALSKLGMGGSWPRRGAPLPLVDLPLVGPPGSSELPTGFDADGEFSRDPWHFGPGESVHVDVAVDPAEASQVVTELGPDAVVGRTDDGGVVVGLEVTDVEALVSWVLDLLDHAEVLRPDEVRAAVVERLDSIVAAAGGAR